MKQSAGLNRLPETIPEALKRFEASEKTALICGSQELSYRELLSDARHIARALMERGVKKGDRVVQDMSRSADYMRVYLGIIYAGAVQVALHSGWPVQQRSRVLSDCAPVLVVDNDAARDLLFSPVGKETSSGDEALMPPEDAEDPLPGIQGKDPFQIIYTSGSTGVPKGVVNCHQLAVSTLADEEDTENSRMVRRFFSEGFERVLMDCNPAFALSGGLYFRAFLNEKTLVIATEDEIRTPSSLASCIRRTGADVLHSVSSRFLQFLDDPEFAGVLSVLRLIVFVGEMADAKVLDALDQTGAELRYVYASSEAWVSMFSPPCRKGKDILYDAPIKAMPVCLLEEEGLREVSPGESGEICIGGNGGRFGWYWNDPQLTAKKYIDHPDYGRLLRTGDSARLEKNGKLRILGRLDRMAKIHGQRVELSAIEAVMEAFPGICLAAVKIQGEGLSAVLCGYYCGVEVSQGKLRRYLVQSLPYYMVPALLMELPQLPLNANGKLDRRALPEIRRRASGYAAPETEVQKLLCKVFAQVLGLDAPVGIDDSFFELGGDSIRGVAAGALLRERGYELKTEWLFAAPTIRSLSPMLQKLKPGAVEEADEPLWSAELSDEEWESIEKAVGRENVEAVYPVLLEAGRFVRRRDPFWLTEMIQVSGDLSEEELRCRLARSVRCHQVLRSIFISVGETPSLEGGGQRISPGGTGRAFQVVLRNGNIPVSTVDLRRLAAKKGSGALLSDAQKQYLNSLKRIYRQRSFSSSVMFEAVLVRLSENSCVLVLAYSHLLLDGAGKVRIWNELACGAPAVSDVRQYNRCMKRLASDSGREESRRAWRKAFDGSSRLTVLPFSPGGEQGTHIRLYAAGEAFAQKAARFCAEMGITVSALTCLALGRVLMAERGIENVLFLSMTSGRNAENAYLSGMFAARFPVSVGKEDTLASVQNQLVSAAARPVPDPDELESALGSRESGCTVLLSMQTYLHTDGVKEIDLAAISDGLSKPREASHGQGPDPSKDITILVFPEESFRIAVVYDGVCFDRAHADVIGRGMLAQLRRLVDKP